MLQKFIYWNQAVPIGNSFADFRLIVNDLAGVIDAPSPMAYHCRQLRRLVDKPVVIRTRAAFRRAENWSVTYGLT